ncbi:MAG: hypothetical protein LBJ67_08490 [Planctomycetaceae bacterium]|jgi:hypothetical protein|nr:hypothetical protein [Planctomycetaceae bacterium]
MCLDAYFKRADGNLQKFSYFLQKWYFKHPEARPIKIAYTGTESLERLGIKDNQQPPQQPESGWFVLGINELYSNSKQYEWLKQFEPIDMIGYSIYIYYITTEDANRVRRKMGLPEIEATTSEQNETNSPL